jgi:hypothetical protein
MNPTLDDPNNHVPEVSPDDVWGDVDGCQPEIRVAVAVVPPTVLPPKRPKQEPRNKDSNGGGQEGLRIESNRQRRSADEAVHQLEVQEIDGSVVRLDPEMPTAPRMPRQITFHEKPVEVAVDEARKGEGREWGKVAKHSRWWILGTSIGVAAVVVFALMMLPRINQANAAKPRPGDYGLVVDQDKNVKAIQAINDMLARQPEAEQIYRKFATALIAEDVVPLLHDFKRIEPLFKAAPSLPALGKDWDPSRDTTWSVFESQGTPFGILEGTLPDFTRFSAYLVLTDGRLLLDWKGTTAYSTATFEQLAENQGDSSEIRAFIKPSGYYSAVFPESEYQSYQLISPDNQDAVWCYTRHKTPAAAETTRLFPSGDILDASQDAKKATLRLIRGPEGSLPNQWLVEEMLHKDWISH